MKNTARMLHVTAPFRTVRDGKEKEALAAIIEMGGRTGIAFEAEGEPTATVYLYPESGCLVTAWRAVCLLERMGSIDSGDVRRAARIASIYHPDFGHHDDFAAMYAKYPWLEEILRQQAPSEIGVLIDRELRGGGPVSLAEIDREVQSGRLAWRSIFGAHGIESPEIIARRRREVEVKMAACKRHLVSLKFFIWLNPLEGFDLNRLHEHLQTVLEASGEDDSDVCVALAVTHMLGSYKLAAAWLTWRRSGLGRLWSIWPPSHAVQPREAMLKRRMATVMPEFKAA